MILLNYQKRKFINSMRIRINKQNIIVYLLILDILFLPYIKIIGTSLSSILLILILIFNFNTIYSIKRNLLVYVFFILAILSFMISCFRFPMYKLTNLSRLVILVMTILLFIYLKNCKVLNKIHIEKILLIYLFFNTILALIFYFNVGDYFQLKNIWSLSLTQYDSNTTANVLTRFCGIVSDPNNCACLTISICAFLDNYKLSKKYLLLKNVMSIFIVVATMSVSGIMCLAFYFSFIYILRPLFEKKVNLLSIIINISSLILIISIILVLLNSDIGSLLIDRIELNSTGGGRIERWINILSNFNILKYTIIGLGGTLVLNGTILNPHNGFLYLIYNYGLIVAIIFTLKIIVPFFKSVPKLFKENLFFIFFLINFIYNTVLLDYRVALTYTIIYSTSLYMANTKRKIHIKK